MLWRILRWLDEIPKRREFKGLPRGCWHCEALGICRRPKEEGWKCYNGCLIINNRDNKKRNNIKSRDCE